MVKPVKIDLRKQFKHLYSPSATEAQIVDAPKLKFLMVDGAGAPESEAFASGIQTLYSLSYTVKFDVKKSLGSDYPVMALEGLWWMGRSAGDFDPGARDKWRWTLMIMQPDFLTAERFKAAAEQLRKKRKPLGSFRFGEFHEGLSAQVMHIGPYSTEASTIEKLHQFIKEGGYELNGKHHEVYLGDPRRAAPSKLRTIVRQPVRRT